jgi:sec-independent protein translocase protein TatC
MSQQIIASQNADQPPSEIQEPFEESKMTLMEHLIELRMRLIWIVGAMVLCTLLSMIFVTQLLEIIVSPLQAYGTNPQALGPTDTIGIFFKVSFTAGTALALPMIIYQTIAFMAPGLYPHEKRSLILIIPGVLLLFLAGASFAYFMLMPVAIGFLQNFLGTVIRQDWSIDRYINFVTRLIFWIGVSFEMPLVVAFLARTGLVSGPMLLGFWRQAIVIIAILAAAITPTVDPVNMSIVMGPLTLLYFLSVGLAYMLYRPRTVRDFSD